MAELVDALDSGSSRGNSVDVRVILAAMTFACVSSGSILSHDFLASRLPSFDTVIAVDGGLKHLIQIGLKPDLIIGDLDSVTEEDLTYFKKVEILQFPQDKDDSDTDLAVKWGFENGLVSGTLFGVLEGRSDHVLNNLLLLTKYPKKLSIETESETIYAISDNKKEVCQPGELISLVPYPSPLRVKTKGFKWELEDQMLEISLSNRTTGHEFEVTVSGGKLLIIKQKHV